MSATQKLFTVIVGLYIGKYYPQYVPLPEINKHNINKLLRPTNISNRHIK